MKDNTQPKRNIFLSILPYILLLLAIGGFATLIILNNSSNVDHWTADTLDQQLSTYEVKTAYTNTNYETTLIEGQYRRGDGVLFAYSVRVDNNEYNDSFSVVDLENPETTKTHQSWQSLFRYEIDAYKVAHPEEATGAKFQVGNAFEVSWWDSWGPTIILLAGTIIVAIFLFSRLSSSVNSTNNKALEFNKSRARREDASKIRFTDVAGCDEEKAEMVEIVSYLKEPKKFSKFGAKLPKGILLVGPPGTGKTLLAKAVAGEAGVPFYSISGSDFVEMFVGVGAGRVRDMFKRAKQTAPCLIFIDEIDAVGRQRGAGLGGGNDEREQTLNQLLVEMDGFSDNSGIIVIAATNREDVLDPALLRAGRFDRQITVSLPDRRGRAAIFRVHARNKTIDPLVDFDALAKRTVGFSGADIENILNEAAILAVRGNKNSVTIKEIDEAIDRRIAGPAKSSRALNTTERKSIAYHEAGHAIIGLSLPHSDRVQKITIIPRGNTGGHVLMTPDEDRFLLTKKELEARIVGYLGGRSSEEVFFNDVSTGAHNDIEMATHIARLMVTEYGMSSLGPIQYEKDSSSVFLGRDYTSTQKNFSTQVAYEIDSEVRKIIDDAHKQALKIIKDHRDQVVLIAETLLEKETITAEEIESVLAGVNVSKQEKTDKETKPIEEPPAVKKDKKDIKKDGE
ncbi:MAG: ATP-dependent zinc metalloprotease FtsH [Bacilli bacterium]|jgi:cell division protease FtsH